MPINPAAAPEMVTIHYRRPPDREQVFRQKVVAVTPDYVVTLLDSAPLSRPVVVDGRTVLEPGAPVVWFTYPGRWYDIGRFHLRDRTFTGIYANVLTPVRMQADCWETTDLFLDVWKGADGHITLLDEAEFADAVERRWIDLVTADTARRQADTLLHAARQGTWPGAEIEAFQLTPTA